MSKLKKLVAIALSLCACVGMFAFSACGGGGSGNENQGDNTQTEGGDNTQTGDSGNQGDNTQTGDSGNQGDNTQTGDENEPEHIPVTTVANADEWRQAFKNFFNVKNLHVKCVETLVGTPEFEGYLPASDCYFDYENSRYLCDWKTVSQGGVDKFKGYDYNEADSLGVWWCGYSINCEDPIDVDTGCHKSILSDYWEEAADYYLSDKSEQTKRLVGSLVLNNEFTTLAILRLEYCNEDNIEEGNFIGEFFDDFTYENGCYVSESLGIYDTHNDPAVSRVRLEVEIKDGIISKYLVNTGNYEMYFTVDNVNKTTVTVPEGAREAIDAEKEKIGNAEKVDNEAAWKNAFDFAALDSFTVDASNGEINQKMQVDLVNCKGLYTLTASSTYLEYSDNALWTASLSDGSAVAEKNSDCADIAAARQQILTSTGVDGVSRLGDMYSYFRFNEEDYSYVYVMMNTITYKIKIAEGKVAEYVTEITSNTGKQTIIYKFKDYNSTTVQTPTWAREAIDVEKAKG